MARIKEKILESRHARCFSLCHHLCISHAWRILLHLFHVSLWKTHITIYELTHKWIPLLYCQEETGCHDCWKCSEYSGYGGWNFVGVFGVGTMRLISILSISLTCNVDKQHSFRGQLHRRREINSLIHKDFYCSLEPSMIENKLLLNSIEIQNIV